MKKNLFFAAAILTVVTMFAETKSGHWSSGDYAGLYFSWETSTLVGTITGYDGTNTTVTLPTTTEGNNGGVVTITFKVIAQEAFKDNAVVEELIVPETYNNVGLDAFYNASKLVTLRWNAAKITEGLGASGTNVSYFGITSNLKTIYFGATVEEVPHCFALNTTTLTSVDFPTYSKISKIGARAFEGCTGLTSVRFGYPQNMAIEKQAFMKCTNLTSISRLDNMGEYKGVTAIGESAFQGSTKLKNVSFSDETTTIDKNAFNGTAIEYLTLAGKNLHIGDAAFANNSALEEVTIAYNMTSLPTISSSSVFPNTIKKVNVACSLYDAYKADANWLAVKSDPTLGAITNADLTSEDVVISDAAKSAMCEVSITAPTTCNGKWKLEAIAPIESGYRFIRWSGPLASFECSPTLEISIADVENKSASDKVYATFAKDDDFDAHLLVESNMPAAFGEVNTYVKTYSYSCSEDQIERDNNRFFYEETAQFIAETDLKDWATFKGWDYGSYSTIYENNVELRVDIRQNPMTMEDEFPSTVTALYEYKDIDVRVWTATTGNGTIEGLSGTGHKLGEKLTLTAKPATGKYFKEWQLGGVYNGKKLSSDATLEITIGVDNIYADNDNRSNAQWIIDSGIVLGETQAHSKGGYYDIELIAVFSDTPLGIDETEAKAQTTKVLRDGQLLIIRESKIYTITGQETK